MKNYSLMKVCSQKLHAQVVVSNNWLKRLITIMLLIVTNLSFLMAQTTEVSGIITNTNGEPLPGVNIVIKGTTQGTVTTVDGNYTLQVHPEDILLISFIGFEGQEIVVGNQTTINIKLKDESHDVDEVVVVGYGIQKKSLVTGSISSLKSEDMNKSSAFVESQLQGKTSGVTVLPSSGAPGSSVKIRIRGTSSNGKSDPLYIVDGIKVKDIDFVEPTDIESIEVLKDGASSAIYGAEGGNGVILITTKKGKAGEAVITYNFQSGIQSVGDLPELLGHEDYLTHLQEIGAVMEGGFRADTDWLDEIFETASMQKHNFSISGGNDKMTFFASTSYLNQDGILGGSKANYERITGRVNADYQAKKWLKVGVNMNYTYSDRKNIGEDDVLDGVISRALLIDPLTPVYHEDNDIDHFQSEMIEKGLPYVTNDNGKYYGISRYVTGETVNPVLSLDLANGSTKRNRVFGSSFLTATPFSGFSVTSRFGIDFLYSNNHFYNQPYYYSAERYRKIGTVEDNVDISSGFQWENFFTYDKTFGKHSINLVGGISMEKSYRRYLDAASGPMAIASDNFAEHDYTMKVDASVDGIRYDNKLASYFMRASYSYAGKYMLQASIRRDGSGTSLLPSGKNWGNFPSFSAGWLFSEESFWGLDFIDYGKLRGSWGENGSLSNLPYYSYSNNMTSQGLLYPTMDGYVSVWEASTLGNADLTWETSRQLDIGLDLRFLEGNLSFSVDYFNKETLDLLTLGTPTAASGADSPYFNAGDVENKGFEFDLGFQNSPTKNFHYSINLNATKLKNEVTRLDDKISIIYGTKIQPDWTGATVFSEGEPIWYYYGYKTDGFDSSGNVIFKDVSGDGKISEDDRTNIGDPHPDWLYGANINLNYKNVDFSFTMQGSQGNDVLLAWIKTDRANVNLPKFMFDGRGKTYPKWNDPNAAKAFKSDLLVHDGSYLRIKQIQLGYTIPRSLTNKIAVNNARFFVSLEDFFTFTSYEGMDPEAGSIDPDEFDTGAQKGIGMSRGIDRGSYPIPRKVLFGCSISF